MNEHFFNAIARHDIEKIQDIIDCEIDVNVRNEKGWTALEMAVILGSQELIELLLKNGFDINLEHIHKNTNLALLYVKKR